MPIRFRDFSLTRKMVIALLLSVLPGLLLAFISFALLGMYQLRNTTIDGLRALAEATAIQSARPLHSRDSKAAADALDTLRLNRLVVDAEIRDKAGRPLAAYQFGATVRARLARAPGNIHRNQRRYAPPVFMIGLCCEALRGCRGRARVERALSGANA